MYISEKIEELIFECENELTEKFREIDKICYQNSLKVLNAFNENKISESHFNTTTGYGYNDYGRDAVEEVFKTVLKA